MHLHTIRMAAMFLLNKYDGIVIAVGIETSVLTVY